MRYVLEINVDNAAFEQNNLGPEVARILRGISNHVENTAWVNAPKDMGALRDANGNRVGRHGFKNGTVEI